MTITKYQSGNGIISAENNRNESLAYTLIGKNFIRQLLDRTVTVSANEDDVYGEAYSDQDGRLDSVNATNTTSAFFSNRYVAASYVTTGTTHDPDSFTDVANAFDGDLSTFAYDSGSAVCSLGKTFSAKTVKYLRVKWGLVAGASSNFSVDVETYNGSTWSSAEQVYTVTSSTASVTQTDYVLIDSSVQGVRLTFNGLGTWTRRIYALDYIGDGDNATVIVEHDIPSGTFNSTISSGFATVLYHANETDADINFKFKNGSDDTGWLNIDEKVTFTAFVSEPTKMQIQLVPKGSSPTLALPEIRGCAYYAE